MPDAYRPVAKINLSRIRANAQRIAQEAGVPVIAVIKADAYGLGAREVVQALGGLAGNVVAGFYCFTSQEAVVAQTVLTGKETIALLGWKDETVEHYRHHNIRPVVWDVARAVKLREAHPVLALDTGMQRFAAPRGQIDTILQAGAIDEAFTHATKVEHAELLATWCAGRALRLHAASSGLLAEPAARLDAVRPGLALYRDAVRVTTHLIEVRETHGAAGYTGFSSSTGRHGVIAGGYTTGVKPGVCMINRSIRRIVESGMQSSFVEIGAAERVGDEVTLLGDELPIESIAQEWKTTPHEALWRITSSADRRYTA